MFSTKFLQYSTKYKYFNDVKKYNAGKKAQNKEIKTRCKITKNTEKKTLFPIHANTHIYTHPNTYTDTHTLFTSKNDKKSRTRRLTE